MKLLFDENLSRKLAIRLSDLFPGSTHVALEGLARQPDSEVWRFAKARGFAVVSADADFLQLASALGPPPEVIWGCAGANIPRASLNGCSRSKRFASPGSRRALTKPC